MRFIYSLFFILLLIQFAFISVRITDLTFKGTAYNPADGKTILFTEEHTEKMENGKHVESTVIYKDKAGQQIAVRKNNFSKSKLAPSYKFENTKSGLYESAEPSGTSFKLSYRKNKSETLKTKTITVPEPAIIDAGLNNYIRDKWETLKKGDEVEYNIVVPERFDYFEFQLEKHNQLKEGGKDILVIKMESSSYLIRQIIDPIFLYFDMSTKRLVKYEGTSNIQNDDGDRMVVRTIYPEMGP